MENVLKCKICLLSYNSELKKPTMILCGHTFCKLCISKAENNKCPLCGIGVDLNVLIHNHIVDEMIRAVENAKPGRKANGFNNINFNGYIRKSILF
jgi:hypothetical protein